MTSPVYGDADNNYIVAANGDDTIYGLDGVDYLYGRGGSDQLFGGNGEDSLFGEDGIDTLDGGADSDTLDGGTGNDTLIGGGSADTFIVNDDKDTITDLGFGGADMLQVGPGAQADATVVAAWAATAATTNDGIANLVTDGFAVDLSLAQGSVGFTVTNTGAATSLIGSAQNDTLVAGAGDDLLDGGAGNDMLISHGHSGIAVYSGNQADYALTKVGAATWQVVDTNLADGDSGTDTLIGIPTVQFADATVVLPVNHAPEVAVALAAQAFNEDTPWSFQVPAGTFNDPDADPLSLSATLADGTPLPGWLTFDAETNTFSGTPPQDYNGQIALTVTASDGDLAVSSDFTLTIKPVNDAPVITSGGGGAEAFYSVVENTAAVTTITATDPDVGAYQRFAIIGGADAGLFRIGGKSGALVFKASPDYESPADADHNGVYDVIVRVSDGRLIDTQTLHISVSNVGNEVIGGNTAANDLQGANGNDRLYGYGGNDTLDGGAGNDNLYGGLGNDDILGGLGNDRLYGGAGQDSLTGGAGRDFFVFDLSPNTAGNVDTITDFTHAQGDRILLSQADFSGFSAKGAISADQFYAAAGATTAHDAGDRIIYNTTTGNLYYDADGQGGAAAVQFATIQSPDAAHLVYSDFLIVA